MCCLGDGDDSAVRGYVQQPASCGRMRVRQQRRLRPCTASHVPGKQKDDTSEVSDSTPAQRQQDGCKQPGDTQCRGKSRKPTSRSRRGSRKLCALGLRFAAASLEACGALPRDAACSLCPGPSCALFQLSVWVYRVLRSSSMLLVPGRFCTSAATLRVRALRAVAAQSLLCLPRLRCFAFRPHRARCHFLPPRRILLLLLGFAGWHGGGAAEARCHFVFLRCCACRQAWAGRLGRRGPRPSRAATQVLAIACFCLPCRSVRAHCSAPRQGRMPERGSPLCRATRQPASRHKPCKLR